MSSTPASSAAARFRPGVLLTVCAVAALALLLSLGTWQLERLAWKEGLIAAAEARLDDAPLETLPAGLDDTLDFRPARLEGRFLHDAAMAFGAYGIGGVLGAKLVTPFELDSGLVILVDRGFLPEALLPPRVPDDLEPAGEVVLDGVLRWRAEPAPGWFTPASDVPGRRLYWLDREAFSSLAEAEIAPLVLVLRERPGADDLPRPMRVVPDFTNNHLTYAVTWYSFAGLLIVFYVLLGLRRGREGS